MKINKNNKKSVMLTAAGMAVMTLLTLTKAVPESNIAGYSVFVGIAFFFIEEAVAKTPRPESGLRFNTVLADLKNPLALALVLLPCVSAVLTTAAGRLIFGEEFAAHVAGRAGEILSFDKAALLIVQVVVAAFGEEIAYRGFFLGKGAEIFPFWLCAALSSAIFAAGHIAAGNPGVVLFDVACVFIDSLIFSAIYRKTGNCVVCAVGHILGNVVGVAGVVL